MAISFDSDKDRKNQEKQGISLGRTEDLEIMAVVEDTRRDYGEKRFKAFGFIDGVPYCLAYTLRNDDVRSISLRRARAKEIRRYEQAQKSS